MHPECPHPNQSMSCNICAAVQDEPNGPWRALTVKERKSNALLGVPCQIMVQMLAKDSWTKEELEEMLPIGHSKSADIVGYCDTHLQLHLVRVAPPPEGQNAEAK